MHEYQSLVRALGKYAFEKRGVEPGTDSLPQSPCAELPVQWGEFFKVSDKVDAVRRICVPNDFMEVYATSRRLAESQQRYPAIRQAVWLERDGHIQIEVPFDAGIPLEFFYQLIDEAYDIAWNKLSPADRLKVDLAGLPYDEPQLIQRLLETHQLTGLKQVVRQVARPAILFKTKKKSEVKIPLGATKIGGRPDLPTNTDWPVYRDGKPLAFLTQIKLSDIAKLGTPVEGLPQDGLLSLFSAWGWATEDDADPQTPRDGDASQAGWTVVIHTPPQSELERRKTPRGVNAFKAAPAEPVPVTSLPNHRQEPPLAACELTDDELNKFDDFQSDFRTVQMGHWLKNSDAFASHHLLGGYALFQQQYPEELIDSGRAMLFQIGSDDHTGMCWGDGGELTFYADAKALAKGRFERLWGECQCG